MKFNMLGNAIHAGPVRLSDEYDHEVGDSFTGIAASQKALYDAYSSLNSSKINKTGDDITGEFGYRHPTIDLTKSNNNVGSTVYLSTVNYKDKNNKLMGRLESSVNPNGNISSTWYCRNYKTDGTVAGSKGITMSMDKSGNLTYGVNDADKFLSAIGGLKVKHFVSGNYTFSAGEHKNITINFGSTSNVFNVIPITTPNSAWVFAQTYTWDSANVTLGVYNTYTSAITGTFRVMILYK